VLRECGSSCHRRGAEPRREALLDEYCGWRPTYGAEGRGAGWVVRTHNPPLAPWPGGGRRAAVVAEAQMDAVAARWA